MRTFVVLFLLLATVVSSIIFGYPPMYYIYVFHEVLLVLLLLWLSSVVVFRKYLRNPLETVTLSFIFFFMILSPITTWLAPDYDVHFKSDPLPHVNALVETIGERPYFSEHEEEAALYILKTLKEKGHSPSTAYAIAATTRGKKEDAVIFCAHYDTVPGSPGADDNASGVSVLLEAVVPETPEYTIMIAFFTGEECGLVESRQFVNSYEGDIAAVICVDTVGVGEDFHISSLKKNRSKSFFLSQLVYGLSDAAIPSIGPLYSDHVPFNNNGIRAVGLTRSSNREYSHIHSDKDTKVDSLRLIETGETVQKVIVHFSSSPHPYWFVYTAVGIAALLSGLSAWAAQNLIPIRKKVENRENKN